MNPKKAVTKKELVNSKPVWEFRGNTLSVRHAGVAAAVVIFSGKHEALSQYVAQGIRLHREGSEQPSC
jgi:hypothetical protein